MFGEGIFVGIILTVLALGIVFARAAHADKKNIAKEAAKAADEKRKNDEKAFRGAVLSRLDRAETENKKRHSTMLRYVSDMDDAIGLLADEIISMRKGKKK